MPSLDDIFREVEVPPERRQAPARPIPPRHTVEVPAVEADSYGSTALVPVQPKLQPQNAFDPADGAPGRFTHGPKRAGDGNRNERARRKLFADLWVEMAFTQPPNTKSALLKIMADIRDATVLVMKRDALLRLAAWAIAAATDLEEELQSRPPPPVSNIFAQGDDQEAA